MFGYDYETRNLFFPLARMGCFAFVAYFHMKKMHGRFHELRHGRVLRSSDDSSAIFPSCLPLASGSAEANADRRLKCNFMSIRMPSFLCCDLPYSGECRDRHDFRRSLFVPSGRAFCACFRTFLAAVQGQSLRIGLSDRNLTRRAGLCHPRALLMVAHATLRVNGQPLAIPRLSLSLCRVARSPRRDV